MRAESRAQPQTRPRRSSQVFLLSHDRRQDWLGQRKGAYQYACCKQSAAPAINCSIEACIATQPTSWASLARRKTIVPEVPKALPRTVVSGAHDRGRALGLAGGYALSSEPFPQPGTGQGNLQKGENPCKTWQELKRVLRQCPRSASGRGLTPAAPATQITGAARFLGTCRWYCRYFVALAQAKADH